MPLRVSENGTPEVLTLPTSVLLMPTPTMLLQPGPLMKPTTDSVWAGQAPEVTTLKGVPVFPVAGEPVTLPSTVAALAVVAAATTVPATTMVAAPMAATRRRLILMTVLCLSADVLKRV